MQLVLTATDFGPINAMNEKMIILTAAGHHWQRQQGGHSIPSQMIGI